MRLVCYVLTNPKEGEISLSNDNCRLFYEDIGDESNPTLIYVHGGPGTGAYDFVIHQRDFLSDKLRLIAFDQRGVLRSQRLMEGEPFGLSDLIEDIEYIRKKDGRHKVQSSRALVWRVFNSHICKEIPGACE